MIKTERIVSTGLMIVFLIVGGFYMQPAARAQEETSDQVLLTWQSDSSVPPWYEGRRLPVAGGKIKILAQLLLNGHFVGTADYDVRWFVNDFAFAQGRGLNQIELPADAGVGNYSVAIILTGQTDVYSGRIEIPVSQPEVVIDAPYYENLIPKTGVRLRSWLYFFLPQNIKNISTAWSIGNDLFSVRAEEILFDLGDNAPSQLPLEVVVQSDSLSETLARSKIILSPIETE